MAEFSARHAIAAVQRSLHNIAQPPDLEINFKITVKINVASRKLTPRYSRGTKPVNDSHRAAPKWLIGHRPDLPAVGKNSFEKAVAARATAPPSVQAHDRGTICSPDLYV
jgi:hypothetical protein